MLAALMARRPVSKELWRQLQPLIPAFVPSAKGGARKLAVSDEAALNGILFVLQTGIPWEDLPQSLGYGSGMTCWRRLRDWNAAGVWEQLHQAMRSEEHTSELQSQSNLVCRLLLEKKKAADTVFAPTGADVVDALAGR